MTIQALHPTDDEHLIKVMQDVKSFGHINLRGFYEPMDDTFYLLEGCHRIECAKQLQVPVHLIDCPFSASINVQIPNLINFDGDSVFDTNGFAKTQNIIQACNWIGFEYIDSDFLSVEIKPLH